MDFLEKTAALEVAVGEHQTYNIRYNFLGKIPQAPCPLVMVNNDIHHFRSFLQDGVAHAAKYNKRRLTVNLSGKVGYINFFFAAPRHLGS